VSVFMYVCFFINSQLLDKPRDASAIVAGVVIAN